MELKHVLLFSGALFLLSVTVCNADTYDNEIIDEGKQSRSNSADIEDLIGEDYFGEVITAEKTAPTTADFPDQDKEVVEEPIQAQVASCLGCPAEIDPKNDKVHSLAQFAFTDYLTTDSEPGPEKTLVRVLNAKFQVVAGIKYMLELEIGWTNCSKKEVNPELTEDDAHDTTSTCTFDESKPTFICSFHIVEKSWLNSKEVVLSKCLRDNEEAETPVTTTGIELTEDGKSYDYDSLDDDIIPLPPTEDSTTADGSIYESRRKRDTSNFGSLRDIKEDKSVIEDIAKFALSELDRIDEDNNARLLVEIISAKKQTVSGWLYHLKLRVAPSSCEEGTHATLEMCEKQIIYPLVICDVKVLLQPWQIVQKKLTQGECVPMKSKQSKKLARKLFGSDKKKKTRESKNDVLIGGRKVIDPTSDELTELVNFAVDSVDAQSNALHAQKLVRVVYADRQLVSGILTNMVIEVGYTTCRKTPTLDKSTCSIDETRKHQYCNITIHEKPWLEERTVKSAKCGKIEETTDTRNKRSINMFSIPEFDADYAEFGNFIKEHDKTYESQEEYIRRFTIFKDNMRKVKLLQENEQGTAKYGATRFADLTEEEFTKRHLGLRPDLRQRMKRKQAKVPVLSKLPDEFDWRHYNIVTPVKNQGMCGSCWAFSVTGNIEGLYALKHSTLQSFSEQELVDCDTLDEGCNGGLPENAYKAIEKLGGLETELNYPYDGRSEKCHYKSQFAEAKVTGFVDISKNETEMAAWLVKNGPISIGINANAMQFYFGGVSHPWKFLCSPKNLDHGVLIVGYGVHIYPMFNRTLPFWAIKNSWGETFGEEGYYRVYRGDGTCGLNLMATSAIIG